MTTDNKTLADVQPGGRVRLGDQALRVFSAGRWTYDGTGQSFSHEEMDAAAFVVYRDAALPAQPSPAGQDVSASTLWWLMDAANTLSEGGNDAHAEHLRTLYAALAARQPVGEPVAVSRMVSTAPEKIFLQIGDGDYSDEPFPHPVGEEITWCSDSIVESEVAYVRSDLAAPRAHTVDLSRFRSLARWVANSAGHGINSGQRRMGEELLALIDSQAVGNG